MNWQDILAIVVPLGGVMAWVYNRIEKRFEKIEQKMEQRFDQVDQKLQILDSRISRIEGQLAPRIWMPEVVEKKDNTQ